MPTVAILGPRQAGKTTLALAIAEGGRPCNLEPERALVVYPGDERYRIAPSIEATGLAELCETLDTTTL